MEALESLRGDEGEYFRQEMVQPSQQTDYCMEYDNENLRSPLIFALAELQGA